MGALISLLSKKHLLKIGLFDDEVGKKGKRLMKIVRQEFT